MAIKTTLAREFNKRRHLRLNKSISLMKMFEAENLGIKINGQTIVAPVSFSMEQGHQLLISGASGTGKTTLLHAFNGTQFFSGKFTVAKDLKMILVEQQHRFKNLSNTSTFYYQQRFNSGDTLDAETVADNLRHQLGLNEDGPLPEEVLQMLESLHILRLLETRLIQLSNGENKRLQIAKALLLHPDILLLDNPFVGLDVDARANLEQLLQGIIDQGVHLVISTSGYYCPDFITDVLLLSHDQSPRLLSAADFRNIQHGGNTVENKLNKEFNELIKPSSADFEFAVRMLNVNVKYENRQILDNINWEVRKGERWAVSGHNGSGKSTLLSLVNADNPQAYANQVFLFDRKRGTGESIWDIKKKIGFVSPELHVFFDAGISCSEVVASGLFDTIGLFRVLSEDQNILVEKWLKVFKLSALKNKMFSRVSTSEQRLLLLARALVKDPPMLILDEPCQGLDQEQVNDFRALVNEIVLKGNKTLLYVSHYKEEIPPCVDKFLLLEDGRRIS